MSKKTFDMRCFSMACAGYRFSAKGVVKFIHTFVRDCPDCGSALKQCWGGNEKVKDKKNNPCPDANYGLKVKGKDYLA